MRRLSVMVLLLCVLSGRSGSDGTTTSPSIATTTTTAPPSPSPTALYRVTFEATWSRETHPDMFPSNPHFSGLIGATHLSEVRFWEEGELASDGIEAMAERGSKSPLDQEIERAIMEGRADSLLSGGGIDRSPGSVSLELTVSVEQPSVTLVFHAGAESGLVHRRLRSGLAPGRRLGGRARRRASSL